MIKLVPLSDGTFQMKSDESLHELLQYFQDRKMELLSKYPEYDAYPAVTTDGGTSYGFKIAGIGIEQIREIMKDYPKSIEIEGLD